MKKNQYNLIMKWFQGEFKENLTKQREEMLFEQVHHMPTDDFFLALNYCIETCNQDSLPTIKDIRNTINSRLA